MSDLPRGWSEATLSDLCNEISGSIEPSSTTVYELYSVPSFPSGRPEVINGTEIGSAKRPVKHNDVLLCKINPRINRVWIVGPSGHHPQIASTEFMPLRLPDGYQITARYLMWYLRSPEFRAWIKLNAEGATGSHTRAKRQKILRQVVPIAPLAEQERIVSAVEEQFSRLDAGVAALGRALQNLKRIRTAVLLAAVTGRPCSGGNLESGQMDLPDEWSWRPLEEVIETLRNGIFVSRPVVEPGDLPILRISAVRPMFLNVEDVRYVPPGAKLNNVENYFVDRGDLLFTRYSGNPEYVGACAMVPEHAERLLHPDKLIRVKVNRAIAEPRFMEIAASVGATRQAIRRRVKTTAGQTGISGSDLKSVLFPVPPIEIQRRIIDEVDQVLVGIQRTEDAVRFGERRSTALRSSILATAFSGKLVAQDPDDEPASVLLERLAAQRMPSNGHRARQARKPRLTEQR